MSVSKRVKSLHFFALCAVGIALPLAVSRALSKDDRVGLASDVLKKALAQRPVLRRRRRPVSNEAQH